MNLADYDIIVCNTSAGKDSQVTMDVVCGLATAQNVLPRVTAIHCDLKRVEWRGTRELAARQAAHYGVRFEVISRNGGDLLDHIGERGMFPSSTTRYCTSDHKRKPACRVLTMLVAELALDRPARVLNCLGFRAGESPARAKRQPFTAMDPIYSNKTRRWVDTWLPIHTWTTDDVWARIRQSGVEHHFAYDLGMQRLSCCLCIFAPRASLLIAGEHNPELLAEYVAVERRIGHTFRVNQSLVEIQTALAAGERGTPAAQWMACA